MDFTVVYVLSLDTSAETADKRATRGPEVSPAAADTSVHCQFSAVLFGPFCPRVFKSIKKKTPQRRNPLKFFMNTADRLLLLTICVTSHS